MSPMPPVPPMPSMPHMPSSLPLRAERPFLLAVLRRVALHRPGRVACIESVARDLTDYKRWHLAVRLSDGTDVRLVLITGPDRVPRCLREGEG